MAYLLHTYPETVSVLDSEGRSYHIPPNEPWEVPEVRGTDIPGPIGSPAYKTFSISSAKMADILAKEGVHYGLVKVMEIKTRAGVSFDVEGAQAASTTARTQSEDAMLQAYVKGAKEDELGKLAVRPPSAPIRRILNARGLDLKRDFGVQPVGYTVSDGAKQRDAQMAALIENNARLEKMIVELQEAKTAPRREKQPA